jgi:DNA-binding NarL/FixJ family response regulator
MAAGCFRVGDAPSRRGEDKRVRVLIVDDHPIVISGCKALLAVDAACEVRDAPDAETGERVYFSWKPDVAVIDLNLPGLSGLEACRRIRARDAQARLVVFSMNEDPVFAARAIEAGAKGYIAKSDDPSLFVEAVRQVAQGGVYLHPDMARQVAFLRTRAPAPAAELTPREQEILRLLAAGRSIGEISDALHVSYKTVANNCTALKQKLGARSSMDLMRVALERGAP